MTDQPSQNNSNTDRSRLDQQQIIQDVHIPEDNALKTVRANSLVPREFSKVILTYVASGPGKGEIETATYYDAGVKQVGSFFARGDQQPSPEITTFLILDADPVDLNQKYVLLDDPSGRVGVFFATDGDLTIPSTGAARDIKVDILSTDDDLDIASKLGSTLAGDAQFIAISSGSVVTATSATNGNKLNAQDVGTGFTIEVTDGKPSKTLNSKHFLLYGPTDSYHVWYDVNGGGTDPAPTANGIEVDISENAEVEEVIENTIAALNETRYFTARAEGTRIDIIVNQAGPVTDIVDADTDFTHFRTLTDGIDKKIIRTVFITYNADKEIDTVDSY